MSAGQYARFLLVGAFVALITIAAREGIGLLLGADTPLLFSISVVVAYAIGIALSFLINRKFTFSSNTAGGWKAVFLFILVALIGMALTWMISLALRYELNLESKLGSYSAAVSFAAAALLTSGITYPLNALLIFQKRSASAGKFDPASAQRWS